MNAHILFAVATALGLISTTFAKPPVPVHATDRDASNPRNVRWEWPVIEWVEITPRARVSELGDKPGAPQAENAVMTIVVRNAGREPSGPLRVLGLPDGLQEVLVAPLDSGERFTIDIAIETAEIPYGSLLTLAGVTDSAGETPEVFDTFPLYGADAHRVALVATDESWRDGDERFGSMVRRFRKSFDDLHALYDVKDVAGLPPHGGDPTRPPIADRYRIEHVERFDPSVGTPALFTQHPEFDLVIAVNEGGPLCCFWLNEGDTLNYYSIGHNFLSDRGGTEKHGIWSKWGEQAGWHEMFHYRGVPDLYIYNVPAGSLPGRSPDGWKLGASPGTAKFQSEMMNDPYTAPELSWLTATIVNSKHGVSRIDACENPEQQFGHMWQWVPKELAVQVEPGEGESVEAVRVYRAKPGQGRDARVQRVAGDAEPVASANGESVMLQGDYMNAAAPRNERALWLLIETSVKTSSGIERRWTIVTLLEMNEAWARGSSDAWVLPIRSDDMSPCK